MASWLMRELIRSARAQGLKRMEGFVLAQDSSMLNLARHLGFTVCEAPGSPSRLGDRRKHGGELHGQHHGLVGRLTMPLSPRYDDSRTTFADRRPPALRTVQGPRRHASETLVD